MSEQRSALVTGASRGLGATLARRLAAEGWHTIICSRDAAALRATCESAAADGLALHPIVADVTDEDSVAAMFDQVEIAPPLMLCVNNAGTNASHQLVAVRTDSGVTTFRPYPTAQWRDTVELCLGGTFLVGRRAAEVMLRQKSAGAIVNISSAVSAGAYGQSAYAAAKAGVESLTRTWAIELGEHGIRVVAVSPGVIDSETLNRRMSENERHAAYMTAMKDQIPLRRWCTADDVASAVLAAASNSSMTGTVLEVNGGGVPRRVHS